MRGEDRGAPVGTLAPLRKRANVRRVGTGTPVKHCASVGIVTAVRHRLKGATSAVEVAKILMAATAAAALALLMSTRNARAQTSPQDPSDLQAWYGAVLELNLPNGWESSLQYRLRMVDGASSYRGSYVTAEGRKELVNGLAALGGYRLARVEDGTFHRFAVGAEATYDPSDALRLTFRPQIQHQEQTFADDDEQSGDQKTLLRTRLRARYELTPSIDVYASTEPYFAFGEDYPIDNWRNTFGVKHALPGGLALDLFYIYRPDYARSYNRTFHVIGIELEIARDFP